MTIQLYMTPPSPPVRAVQMTAKTLGISLELKVIDTLKEEQKKPEFVKINPQHTVPVINDNGIILWDSHAINAYLVSKYSKDDSLYPKDLVKRAIVDQRLHFDTGVLFHTGNQILGPIFFGVKQEFEEEEIDSIQEVYEFLEKFLDGKKWIAGDSKTIADYSIYTTLSTLIIVVPINPNKFPQLYIWYNKIDALPESDVTKPGLKRCADVIKKNLGRL